MNARRGARALPPCELSESMQNQISSMISMGCEAGGLGGPQSPGVGGSRCCVLRVRHMAFAGT